MMGALFPLPIPLAAALLKPGIQKSDLCSMCNFLTFSVTFPCFKEYLLSFLLFWSISFYKFSQEEVPSHSFVSLSQKFLFLASTKLTRRKKLWDAYVRRQRCSPYRSANLSFRSISNAFIWQLLEESLPPHYLTDRG